MVCICTYIECSVRFNDDAGNPKFDCMISKSICLGRMVDTYWIITKTSCAKQHHENFQLINLFTTQNKRNRLQIAINERIQCIDVYVIDLNVVWFLSLSLSRVYKIGIQSKKICVFFLLNLKMCLYVNVLYIWMCVCLFCKANTDKDYVYWIYRVFSFFFFLFQIKFQNTKMCRNFRRI